jgi:PAS domain S-box-containing protein
LATSVFPAQPGPKTDTGASAAEERLRASESKYRTLFESSTDGIFIVGLDGRLLDANPAAYTRLGYTREEFLALDIRLLDAPEYAARVPERFRQVLEEGSALFESAHRRKDGSAMPVEVNSRLLEHGGRTVFFSVIRDITERKRAEEEIAAQRAMLQQILDTSSVAIFLVDNGGRITHANRCMAEMFGRRPEELLGHEYVALVHPAEREAGRAKMLALLAGHLPSVDLERLYQRGDGSEFWGHLTGRRFRDAHGAELGLVGVISDVTERRRAEDALRKSEKMLQSIIETEPECVKLLDADGRLVFMNRAGLDMLQVESLDEIRGQPVGLMVLPEHRKAFVDFTRRVFRGDSGTLLFEMVGRLGRRLWLETHAVPLRDERDQIVSLLGVTRDVTERRLLEEERLRTQKLESIGTLAGGIAHDFNNLLQGIFGYIAMAKLSLDRREKALSMLEQAEKALHQSVNLTTQLLTFSKGGRPVRRVLDLRPVIENAVRFALSGSRVTCEVSCAADLLPVEADEGQIGQVLQNIVLNAEQAMPLGGRIELVARNAPASRAAELGLPGGAGLVEIAVADQGTGIPPAHLPRIFDPYFTTKEKGSGLGLATSYSIVRNHEGAITVRSELGKGSIFTVSLPASTAARAVATARTAPLAAAPCRVLVMDDEAVVLGVAGELLRTLGHTAAFAEEGAAAVAQYAAARAAGTPFDVVVLDLTVRGGMGGEETLRALLEIDPGARVVVSSGYSDDDVAATFRKRGFRAFLKKPYSLEELERVLVEARA